jgi:hypothetical protein
VGAEKLGQRQIGTFGFQVPKRDVESGNGLDRQTAAANGSAGPNQLIPKPGNVVGILADQFRSDFLGMDVLAGAARLE